MANTINRHSDFIGYLDDALGMNDVPTVPVVTICEYFHNAGPLFGLVDQIGTDEYLNAGAAVNCENHDRDVRAMRIFAADKFAAAEREASRVYGWQPLAESD